ncbi:hypothetical protein SteCoe_20738 [Stentor coeruleus]|uniref:Calpain catalytic domain-containing protein n=1 Tax=Stentor coeruleus TaxID=5963 RepID=A0A1R2BR97_9CILI|nr:hypothetical protein SteCoe_20738 [Stentor coeruleus]
MEAQVISKEIYPGVLVHRQILSDALQEFLVENKRYNTLDFEIDFSGSEGIRIENSHELTINLEILPTRTQPIARVITEAKFFINSKFRFNLCPPPADVARQLIAEDSDDILKKLRSSSKIFKNLPINKVSLDQISSELKGNNFVDPDFSPSDSSIYAGYSISKNELIHWRRPIDIFSDGFTLFPDEIEPNDIRPGNLENYWFLSALSTLSERPQLVKRLFFNEEVNPDGVYRLRFCKGGEWVVVTVDDYFPCLPQGNPIYSRSYNNDIWVLLLEKAYAKLHGSYMLLRNGWAHEALLDLTGCPSENLLFDSKKVRDMIDSNSFWGYLRELDENGALLSACVTEEHFENSGPRHGGLMPGYSYTILQLRETRNEYLINIRNPWGYFEWEGDWSNKSPLWTPELINSLHPELGEDDGTFWMSFRDFLNYFNSINICRVKTFYEARVHGKFLRLSIDERSCVISKFYYCLDIPETTKIYIGVHQEDERVFGADSKRTYLDIGLVIFKRDRGDNPVVYSYKSNENKREIEIEIELQPGSYVILPRTTGCRLRRPVNAAIEYPSLLLDKQLHPLFLSTIKDIFRKYDIMLKGELGYHEFKNLMETCSENIIQKDFENIKANFCSTQFGLTQEGLVSYFKDAMSKRGDEKIWEWLLALGYDKDFYSIKSRVFLLSLHSTCKLKLTVRDAVKSNLDKLATLELLKKYGRKKNDQADVELLSLVEPDAAAFTYGVFNKLEDKSIKPTLDCSKAKGVLISTMSDIITVTLPPKTGEILAHFVRVDENFDFRVNFVYTIA